MKTLRLYTKNFKVFAFKKWLAVYGKTNSGKYAIEVALFDFSMTIYRSKRKPLIKNLYLINLAWLPFYIIVTIIVSIAYGVKVYAKGLLDVFFTDFIDREVKVFSIANLVITVLLVIALILK